MIHFAICDDEPAQARLLSQLVSGWCAGQGEACQITCYPSAEALLFAWEDEPSADILLLDILMGQMNGHELARRLRQQAGASTDSLHHRNPGLCLCRIRRWRLCPIS